MATSLNATVQAMHLGTFQTLLAETAGDVLYDPWATVPTGDAVATSMWGQMVECEDPMVTDRCFVKYSSSGLERYIVYDQYNSCAQSWILLPGFNLLEQKLLIGACARDGIIPLNLHATYRGWCLGRVRTGEETVGCVDVIHARRRAWGETKLSASDFSIRHAKATGARWGAETR